MKRALTTEQTRELERARRRPKFGMPEALLMENAGGALADEARPAGVVPRVASWCCAAAATTAGDGLVAARKLAGPRADGAAGAGGGIKSRAERGGAAELPRPRRVRRPGGQGDPRPTIRAGPGDVVIDALFGTGLNRAPEERVRGGHPPDRRLAGRWGRRCWRRICPSGLDADAGRAFDCPRVEADVHPGHLREPEDRATWWSRGHGSCPARCGWRTSGCPRRRWRGSPVPLGVAGGGERCPEAGSGSRRSDAHKGTFGHVLVVAGSWGKSGAAALCAEGALLRAGAAGW